MIQWLEGDKDITRCPSCGKRYDHPLDAPNQYDKKPYRCPVCSGSGKVYYEKDPDGVIIASRFICRACHGTGLVWG